MEAFRFWIRNENPICCLILIFFLFFLWSGSVSAACVGAASCCCSRPSRPAGTARRVRASRDRSKGQGYGQTRCMGYSFPLNLCFWECHREQLLVAFSPTAAHGAVTCPQMVPSPAARLQQGSSPTSSGGDAPSLSTSTPSILFLADFSPFFCGAWALRPMS